MDYARLKADDPGGRPDLVAARMNNPDDGTLAQKLNTELSPSDVARVLQDADELVVVRKAARNDADLNHTVALEFIEILDSAALYGLAVKMWSGTSDRRLLDALVTAGIVSAESRNSIAAMAQPSLSWAERYWDGKLRIGHVKRARTMS